MAENGFVRPRVADLQVAPPPRLSQVVLEAHGLSKSFGERKVLAGVDFILQRGERVGIVGPNGAGKTTFLRLLLGELEPDAGRVVAGVRTRIAYHDQQRAALDPEKTVYEAAGGGAPGMAGEDFVLIGDRRLGLREYLDDLLFPPTMQRMKVKALSGGERNRLLLARLFLEGANVLVLDEPTNDLDLVTLNVLERLLLDFGGSVLLVTHDRYFLDKVATSILAFEGEGHAVRYPGNYETYRTLREQSSTPAPRAQTAVTDPPATSMREPPARARKPGRLSFQEQREMDGMEAAILAAEERKGEVEAALSDPATYQKGGDAVVALRAEMDSVTAEVERLYARWAELAAWMSSTR
jgi:ATP-binding cassette subfamily F protein uup